MFGMEKNKGKPAEKTVFEMENSVKANPHKRKEMIDYIHGQETKIKDLLREQEDQKEHDKLAFMLCGYDAMIRVLGRL